MTSSEVKGSKRGRGATTARMRDVARRAGVSVMTVSRCLNEPSKVSEDMRERVAAAVESLDYPERGPPRPQPIAEMLAIMLRLTGLTLAGTWPPIRSCSAGEPPR